MTQIAKLRQKMLQGSTLTFAEFQRLILAYGFTLDRIHGSHHVYRHARIGDRVNAQPQGKAAKPYQVRQFRAIITTRGLSLDADA